MNSSPPGALLGIVTLNWQRPGEMSPANPTAALTPPMVTEGSVASAPDCLDEPLTTGTPVDPNALAKSNAVSRGWAGLNGYPSQINVLTPPDVLPLGKRKGTML